MDPARRIAALREEIRRHDRLYYLEDAPEISDERYDELFRELAALEEAHPELASPDSPTQRVGGAPVAAFATVEHAAPMLSLDSDKEEKALRRFDERLRKALDEPPTYALEPKLDGLSLELVYEGGVLVRAATRGDGVRGEAVTENVRTIRSVPLRLEGSRVPTLLSVRGEAILRIEAFEGINERLVADGKAPFANPRNAAAGTIRQLDPRVAASRPLDLFAYDVLAATGGPAPETQSELLETLRGWGFRVNHLDGRAETVEEILAWHAELAAQRDELPWEIDGLVVKLERLADRAALGTTARHPRWAFAYKFAPRKEVTRVLGIAPSVGRSGIVTPVALLRPVEIGGVTVARATLHNREEVARKDVREGDLVRVQRAGDVIPQVIERVEEPDRERQPAFAMPAACPSCGTPLVERGPFTVCPAGFDCPAQRAGRLQHLASRDALDIAGLGEETARVLVDNGLVASPPDLWDLRLEQLLPLPGFAEKSAGALLDDIRRAGSGAELARFLYGLGIPEIGVKTARDLAAHFGTLEALRRAGQAELVAVHGVGERMAEQITAWFTEPRHGALLDALLAGRLSLAEGTPPAAPAGAFAGLTFVFTGSLQAMTRRQAQELVEAHGARAAGAVSKSSDYVVVGADAGGKAEKARRLGVSTLDEAGFLALLAERGIPPPEPAE